MSAQVLSPSLIEETVNRILTSRKITRIDQRLLLSFNSVSREEQALLNQVFDRLSRGLLKVVD